MTTKEENELVARVTARLMGKKFSGDYEGAMEIAGATVHAYNKFGSYQGDWWAKVSFQGKNGWVSGSYGSCSGCDAFEGDFGCGEYSHDCTAGNYYSPISDGFTPGCDKCREAAEALIRFGLGYLDNILTQEQAEAEASKHLDIDGDAHEMLDFIKKNAWR